MSVPTTSHKTEKYVGEEDIPISAWDLKRQYKVFNFGQKAEIRWSLIRGGDPLVSQAKRDPLITQANLSAPRVFSGCPTTSQKVLAQQKKDMCELCL